MSKGMILVGVIILGVLTLATINMIQQYQSGNELDYHMLDETTKAAMIDAVDHAYYNRSGGILRVDREKFLESFVRRMSDIVSPNNTYRIRVIDFNETPPKVTIEVFAETPASIAGESFDIVNRLSAVLETSYYRRRTEGPVN